MRLRRSPAAFRVAHQRVLVALCAGESLDLAGAAAAVWLAADDGCDVEELHTRLVATGLSAAQIDDAARELVAAGLLREAPR